jgi:hypothetical protein
LLPSLASPKWYKCHSRDKTNCYFVKLLCEANSVPFSSLPFERQSEWSSDVLSQIRFW